MKFNLGDIVRYTNKNTKEDIQGEVVAIKKYPYEGTQYFVEPFDDVPNSYPFIATIEKYDRRSQYTSHKFKPHHVLSRFVISEKRVVSISGKSKNLVSGILQYDPNQQGDLEDDL